MISTSSEGGARRRCLEDGGETCTVRSQGIDVPEADRKVVLAVILSLFLVFFLSQSSSYDPF